MQVIFPYYHPDSVDYQKGFHPSQLSAMSAEKQKDGQQQSLDHHQTKWNLMLCWYEWKDSMCQSCTIKSEHMKYRLSWSYETHDLDQKNTSLQFIIQSLQLMWAVCLCLVKFLQTVTTEALKLTGRARYRESILGNHAEWISPELIYIPEITSNSKWFPWNTNSRGWTPTRVTMIDSISSTMFFLVTTSPNIRNYSHRPEIAAECGRNGHYIVSETSDKIKRFHYM